MEEYNLYWLTGSKETVEGENIQDAIMLAGYGNGALRALDFYVNVKTDKGYKWDTVKKSWIPDGWSILD